jgi:hypothetical protein
LVSTPSTIHSDSARRARAIASGARLGRDDELREQRVELDAHGGAGRDAGVDTHARSRRLAPREHPSRARQEFTGSSA